LDIYDYERPIGIQIFGAKLESMERAAEIVEEARDEARGEGERIVLSARGEIDRELNQAKESLRGQVSQLAMDGARQILGKEIDSSAHAKMLDDLAAQL